MCGTYLTRPQICRDYTTDNCEYGNTGCYDKFFEAPEQLWEYAEAILPPKPLPRKKRGEVRLPSLPILG